MRIDRLVFLPLALMAVGCFEGQRTFKVNADGSGTIVDTAKLGAQAQEMRKGLDEMDKATPAEKKAKQEGKYKEKAAALGAGVTFVSLAPTKDGGMAATYAFKDVTKLTAGAMPEPDESTTSKDEPLVFKLAKNAAGNSVLTVTSPKGKPGPAKPAKKPEELTQEIGMMKGMLAGLKIRSVVEVNGALVKTSSPNVAGSAVTLIEMDFDQLDTAALTKLASSASPEGPPDVAALKGIKGIKVSEPEVTIEFK
jgi:hypothetical protein